MTPNFEILDCSLRDGGYYFNWSFDSSALGDYLEFVESSSVDLIELGFRNPSKSGVGDFWSLSHEKILVLKKAFLLTKPIGVMIDAKEYLGFWSELLELFPGRQRDDVDFVRIAVGLNAEEFKFAVKVCNELKNRGYRTFLNLMRVDQLESEILRSRCSAASVAANGVYFADSFGSLCPETASAIGGVFADLCALSGFHAHDNCGLGMANVVAVLGKGIKIIDGTIAGMGRGPGNVATETLLAYRQLLAGTDQGMFSEAAERCIENWAKKAKIKLGWGQSLYYAYGGLYRIHPTTIQNILGAVHHSDVQSPLRLVNRANREQSEEANIDQTSFLVTSSKIASRVILVSSTDALFDGYLSIFGKLHGDFTFILLNGYPRQLEGVRKFFVENFSDRTVSLFAKIGSPSAAIGNVVVLEDPSLREWVAKADLEGCGLEFAVLDKSAPKLALALAVDLIEQNADVSEIICWGFTGYPNTLLNEQTFNLFVRLREKNVKILSVNPNPYGIEVTRALS